MDLGLEQTLIHNTVSGWYWRTRWWAAGEETPVAAQGLSRAVAI